MSTMWKLHDFECFFFYFFYFYEVKRVGSDITLGPMTFKLISASTQLTFDMLNPKRAGGGIHPPLTFFVTSLPVVIFSR